MLTKQLNKAFAFTHRSLSVSSARYYSDPSDSFVEQYFFRKSFLKPFTVQSENNLLSVTCVKGRFKEKKDYITLDKIGAVLLEFVPFIKDSEGKIQIDLQAKQNFSLNTKNIGELLQHNPYTFKSSQISHEFQYQLHSQIEDKTLSFHKEPQESALNITLSSNRKGVSSQLSVGMQASDFIVFQELLKYSLPYILGWHILASPRIAEEELNANPPDNN